MQLKRRLAARERRIAAGLPADPPGVDQHILEQMLADI